MNTRIKWLWLLSALIILTSGSCYFDDDDGGIFHCENGEGDLVTRTLDLPDFHGIKLHTDISVYLSQGPGQRVEAEGQDNIIDLLQLDVQNGIWDIEFDHCVRNRKDLKLFITLPQIDLVSVSGSGEVFGENVIEGPAMELRVSGSGDLDLALLTEEVNTQISGSGEVKLEGSAEAFTLKISGSGDYNAFNLETERGDINISGSGDADVLVNEVLDIKISGSGDVRYKGFPILNVVITGSGDVRNAN